MGDVYDALNRRPEPADHPGRDPRQEVGGLPMSDVEDIARPQPGKPMFNTQPLHEQLGEPKFRHDVPGGAAPAVVAHQDRTSPITEQFRQVRTQILARAKDKPRQVHLLTSAAPQEGKSYTVVNLGVVFAELRRCRTLLIEADLRRPSFQRLFERPFVIGLTHVLRGEVEDENEAIVPTVYDNLHVMPAGEHDGEFASELLSGPRMVRLLDRLRDRYDHILIDSPPVISVSDAAVLGALCDQTLLVVRMHKTPREVVRQAKAQLEAAGCTVAGTILTHAQHDRMPRYLYQYESA